MANEFRGVIPMLPVRDVGRALAFYSDVLGFALAGRDGDEFGSVLRGRASFYFHKAEIEVSPAHCYVWVEEVDELCDELRALGARIVEEPETMPWGYRQFTLEDIDGHLLYFFRFAEEEPA